MTKDFQKVSDAFFNTWYAANSAIVIGDKNGVLWQAERGFWSVETELVVASASKIFTTAVIHRALATVLKGKLGLESLIHESLPSFPKTSNATLAHLMAFTTGFDPSLHPFTLPYGDNCGRAPPSEQGWRFCFGRHSCDLSANFLKSLLI